VKWLMTSRLQATTSPALINGEPVIALDSEIVATRYDPFTRTCFYTIERNGKRWTATIPLKHFEDRGFIMGAQHLPSRQQRRDYLASMLEQAMNGPPDA
jgi:hypothetical protein